MHIGHASGLMTGLVHPGVAQAITVTAFESWFAAILDQRHTTHTTNDDVVVMVEVELLPTAYIIQTR